MSDFPLVWIVRYTIQSREGAAIIVANDPNTAEQMLLNQGLFSTNRNYPYKLIGTIEAEGVEGRTADCGILYELKPYLNDNF